MEQVFSQNILLEQICSYLTFEESLNFMKGMGLATLSCPIRTVEPRTSRTLIFPGINPTTLSAYYFMQTCSSCTGFVGEVDNRLKEAGVWIGPFVEYNVNIDPSLWQWIQENGGYLN